MTRADSIIQCKHAVYDSLKVFEYITKCVPAKICVGEGQPFSFSFWPGAPFGDYPKEKKLCVAAIELALKSLQSETSIEVHYLYTTDLDEGVSGIALYNGMCVEIK